jgi:hypothetical protein
MVLLKKEIQMNQAAHNLMFDAFHHNDMSGLEAFAKRANEALPQTDEACFGCGSDRQFMTSSGRTRLR